MSSEIVVLIVVAVGALISLAVFVLAKIAERRNPPFGKFLDIEGVRLHYLERGAAGSPTIVLFHGNGSMIQDLAGAGLIDRLAQRYRVISFDRPGFGHTRRPRRGMTPEGQAALFAAAFNRLNVRDPIVFGHSWGTLVALALALRQPAPGQAVRGLVLAAGYYFPTRRVDVWMASGPAVPVIGDIMCYTLAPILGWLLTPLVIRTLFAPAGVPPAFKNSFSLGLALRPWQMRATAEESALMIPAARRLQAGYAQLSCPVAIFFATGDQLIEAEQAPRLHEAAPASSLHTVHDYGHMLHYAVPDEIVRAIDDIVASTRRLGAPALAAGDIQLGARAPPAPARSAR